MGDFVIFFIILLFSLLFTKSWFHKYKFYRLTVPFFFFILFIVFIFRYIGFDGGTPRLSDYQNIFFQQEGIYSTDDTITFRQTPKLNEFQFKRLFKDDFISLYPLNIKNGNIETWKIEHKTSFFPLRVNNKAININNNQCLNYGDTLRFSLFDSTQVSLDIILEENQEKPKTDLYIFRFFNQNSNNTLWIDTVNFVKLTEGVVLDRLFKKALSYNKKNEQNNSHGFFEKIFSYFLNSKNTIDSLTLKQKNHFYNSPIIKKLRNKVLLFRYIKGHVNSRLFFNIDYTGNDFYVEKRSIAGNVFLIPSYIGIKTDTICSTDILSFGYGIDVEVLSFSDKTIEITGDNKKQEYIAPIYFNNPIRYKLPEKDTVNQFFITSQQSYVDRDFVFKLHYNGKGLPIYAIAKLDKENDSIYVNTGKNISTVSLGNSFYIDNGKNGFILRFSKFHYKYDDLPLSYLILLIFIVLGCLMIIILYKKSENINQSNINLLWLTTIFIVIILSSLKLIFSYRVIAFPPIEANYKELKLLEKSLQIAIFSFFTIPFIYMLPYFKKIFKLRISIQIVLFTILNLPLWFLINSTKYFAITLLSELAIIFSIHYLNSITSFFKEKVKSIHNNFPKINSLVQFFLKKIELARNKFPWIKQNPILIKVFITILPLIILGFFVDNTGAVFKIRYNILSILIIFVGFYFFSQYLKKLNKIKLLRYYIGYIVLVFAIAFINWALAKDNGFVLVYLPLFVLLPLLWPIEDSVNKFLYLFGSVAILLFIGILYLLPGLLIKIHPDSNSAYRLNADNPEYWYEFSKHSENRFDETLFKNNTYQMWQLKNYAANGGAYGKGYSNTKFIKTGVTLPVSLTDGFFSTYLLSEFGYIGGLGFILIFFFLLYVVIQISLRFKKHHLIWFIIAIALYFLHSTLYMAMADISACEIPFTGQNIPFFSLSSKTDAIHFLLLILFIGIITINNNPYNDTIDEYKKEGYKKSYRLLWGIGSLYMIFLIFFVISSVRNSNSKDIKGNFKLPKKYANEFKRYRNNKYITYKNDSIIQSVKVKPLSKFFQSHINSFNSRSIVNQKKPEYGLIYIDDNGIELNENYYNIKSPFSKNNLWKGFIYDSNNDSIFYQLNFFNTVANFNLKDDNSQMETIKYPFDLEHRSNINSQCIKLINSANRNIVEITRHHDGVYIKANRDKSVWINGVELKAGNSSQKKITSDDIIVVQSDADKLKYYFCIDINKGEQLSRLSWINGIPKRIYKMGDIFPFAYNITKAANAVNLESNKDIVLTINSELQLNIQTIIKNYALKHSPYKVHNGQLHQTKQIAFTIMDSYSGKIITLGSWPNFDPNNDKLNEYFNQLHKVDVGRVLINPNMRGHAIGSTFKPLTFSAIALSFNPRSGYDIGSFQVYHTEQPLSIDDGNRYNKFLSSRIIKRPFIHCHHYLAGINFDIENSNNNFWDCNSRMYLNHWINKTSFLAHSLNIYQFNLFALGLIQIDEVQNFRNNFLFSSNTNDLKRTKIRFAGNNSYLDVSSSLTLGDPESYQGFWSGKLPNAVVFKNLDSLFSVNLERDVNFNRYDSLSLTWRSSLYNFLPSFKFKTSGFLKNIIPEPVCMNLDVLEDRRDMEVLMRGGGENNRWCNIYACEAFARISTGTFVKATLQPNSNNRYESLPYPLSGNWSKRNLFPGLEGSASYGTSRACFPPNYSNNSIKILAKTGTLEEGTKGKESEMLVYTIGAVDNQNRFIEGKTFTCYLYMEDSHVSGQTLWQRGKLNKKLSKVIIDYIKSLDH